MTTKEYPEQYLHVEECNSGQKWIVPLRGNATLDLKRQVKRWIRKEFGGQLALDGNIQPKLEGEFYAQILTDGRPPDGGVCWESGGFYLKG